MEPLFTAKRVLVWLCLYPANDSSIPSWTRTGRRLFSLLLVILSFTVQLIVNIFLMTFAIFEMNLVCKINVT